MKQTIVRNSKYANMHVEEEPVEMPTPPVPTVSHQSIHERIKVMFRFALKYMVTNSSNKFMIHSINKFSLPPLMVVVLVPRILVSFY